MDRRFTMRHDIESDDVTEKISSPSEPRQDGIAELRTGAQNQQAAVISKLLFELNTIRAVRGQVYIGSF